MEGIQIFWDVTTGDIDILEILDKGTRNFIAKTSLWRHFKENTFNPNSLSLIKDNMDLERFRLV